MRQTAALIEDIIETGKKRGLNAEAIATRAGIKPANLSRIRKSGRFSADTLERLLVATHSELICRQKARDKPNTLSLVCKKLNAGRRDTLAEDTLRRFLTKFRPSKESERAFSHLVGIIEEIPLEQIHSLVIDGDATLPSLKRIADYVEGEGKTVRWINDQLAS